MGRPKRLYPLGKYRLRIPKDPDKNKTYPVDIEYTWNRNLRMLYQIIIRN